MAPSVYILVLLLRIISARVKVADLDLYVDSFLGCSIAIQTYGEGLHLDPFSIPVSLFHNVDTGSHSYTRSQLSQTKISHRSQCILFIIVEPSCDGETAKMINVINTNRVFYFDTSTVPLCVTPRFPYQFRWILLHNLVIITQQEDFVYSVIKWKRRTGMYSSVFWWKSMKLGNSLEIQEMYAICQACIIPVKPILGKVAQSKINLKQSMETGMVKLTNNYKKIVFRPLFQIQFQFNYLLKQKEREELKLRGCANSGLKYFMWIRDCVVDPIPTEKIYWDLVLYSLTLAGDYNVSDWSKPADDYSETPGRINYDRNHKRLAYSFLFGSLRSDMFFQFKEGYNFVTCKGSVNVIDFSQFLTPLDGLCWIFISTSVLALSASVSILYSRLCLLTTNKPIR